MGADPVSVGLIHIGLYDLPGGALFHLFADLCLRQLQFPGEHPDHRLRLLHLVMDHGDRTDRPVGGDDRAVPVHDLPSGRLDGPFPFMEIVGHGAVML